MDEECESIKLVRHNEVAETLKRERVSFEEMCEMKRSKEIECEAISFENQREYHAVIEKRSVERKQSQ